MVEFRLSNEQEALKQLARDFVNKEVKPLAAELDKRSDPEESFDTRLIKRCSELGFRTLGIPEKYGGGGVEDTVTFVVVCEELSVGDVSLASIPLNGFKLYHALIRPEVYKPEVCDKWLKAFCDDPTFLCATATTEPNSGGDNMLPYDAPGAGLMLSAVKDGGHYVLNGMKHFIAHAGFAKLYLVFARTDPKKGVSGGVSRFLIPKGHPGMGFGRVHDKMGFRLLRNQEIIFEDCRVPEEWRLGPENEGLGKLRGRGDGIINGARALGVARRAFEEILQFCRDRVQGGKPIIEHQMIACELADMYASIQAMRSLVWNIAWSVDNLPRDPKSVPLAMLFCTEQAFEIAHKAAEMAGGMGVMKEAPFEKILRDAFSIKHLDGGNFIKRLKITRDL